MILHRSQHAGTGMSKLHKAHNILQQKWASIQIKRYVAVVFYWNFLPCWSFRQSTWKRWK